MNLERLKIRTRLALGFTAMALLLAMLGGASLYSLSTIHREFSTVLDDRYQKVVIAAEV